MSMLHTHNGLVWTKYFTEQSTCQIKVVFKLKFKSSAEIKLRLSFIKHFYIKIRSILKNKKLLRSLKLCFLEESSADGTILESFRCH